MLQAAVLVLGLWLLWSGRKPAWVKRSQGRRARRRSHRPASGWQPVRGPAARRWLGLGSGGLALRRAAGGAGWWRRWPPRRGGRGGDGGFRVGSAPAWPVVPFLWWRLSGRPQRGGSHDRRAMRAAGGRAGGRARPGRWAHGLWVRCCGLLRAALTPRCRQPARNARQAGRSSRRRPRAGARAAERLDYFLAGGRSGRGGLGSLHASFLAAAPLRFLAARQRRPRQPPRPSCASAAKAPVGEQGSDRTARILFMVEVPD